MKQIHLVVLMAACLAVGAFGGRAVDARTAAAQGLDAAGAVLPAELFAPGQKVMRQKSVYLIEDVQGGWIRARLFQSLDDNAAPNTAPRWIYVPAEPASWAKAG